MKRPEPGTWRYDVVFGLLVVGLAALGARLVVLLRDLAPRAAQLAAEQQRRVIPLIGRPGSLYACTRGGYVLLAGSERVPGCFADPVLLPEAELAPTAAAVGHAVRLERDIVLETLQSRRQKRFAWVKHGLTDGEARAVADLGIRGVGIAHEWRRYYPNGSLAATVLGFRHRDGEPAAGLELAMASELAAGDGQLAVLADNRRRPTWTLPDESAMPRDGHNVCLFLDAIVQGYLERAVAAAVDRFGADGRTWATGVVVDPHTGEVLAMCSQPAFNPNRPNRDDLSACVNRAVGMPYEPGSVMKPLFAAAAVDAGVFTYDSVFTCHREGLRAPRGGLIRDHHPVSGPRTLEEGVVHSINTVMAMVGLRLGNQRLYETCRRFGLGEKTGIEVPGEDAGIIRDLRKWDGYSTPRVPFGQEMSVTALQLAMAFSALVNGGELLRPRLVDQVRDASGELVWQSRREVVRRVISPRTSAETLAVLKQVVEQGTGKSCRLSRWTSFGKTGTAQIPGPGGYVDGAYTATFAGGAPATRPRVLCVISVYWPEAARGYYGSQVAAPYVRDVLEKALAYLRVPADRVAPGSGPYAAGQPAVAHR